MKILGKKATSDHIQVLAFPAKKEAGELCKFGSLVGFADLTTEAGASGTVNVGKQIAVFQIENSFGTPAIGSDVYVASDGTLTTTAGTNKLLGTIVAKNGDAVDVAITG